MANSVQSNPVYYSLSEGQNIPSRTVELRKRPEHNGFGVYIGEDVPTGLYVVTVERDSPAEDAKIQPGDRVLAVNGQLVSSMATNPKETVVKAATDAETLTLTIQSTGTYQTINTPLNDNDNKNNNNRRDQQHSSRPRSVVYDNLESYVKSLFADQNVHIVSSSLNNNEFFMTSDPHTTSAKDWNSGSSRQYPSNDDHPHHHHRHHHHRHHHRRHRKQILRETKETQTSLNYDEDKIIEEMQPTVDALSSHSDNVSGDSTQNKASSPVFAAAPPFPGSDSITSDPPISTPPPPLKHLVDVVETAVAASRSAKPEPNNHEPSPRELSPIRTPSSPLVLEELHKSDSDGTISTRSPTPPPAEPSPPPYTPFANTKAPAANPATTAGAPVGVINALENLPKPVVRKEASDEPKPLRGEGLHEVSLERLPGFNGFGFQLQYNKNYYLIHGVEEGGPAAVAGLLVNDVIHSIDNQMTEKMPHPTFVQMVTSSSHVNLVVQNFNEYCRANPQPPRHQQAAAVVAAAINNEGEKRKVTVGKVLEKIKSH